MAMQPAKPVRGFSFTDWQTANPTSPPPGDHLDGEYDLADGTIGDVIDWVATSLKTDGGIRDGIIGKNQMVSGLFDDVAQDIIDEVQPLVDQATAASGQATASATSAATSAGQAAGQNAAAQAARVAAETAQAGAQLARTDAQGYAITAQSRATDAANSANHAEGDAALAEDWGQVSFAWAEHMPDTIPPNILATMGITGDHWSSRWWANKAAQTVQVRVVVGDTPPASPTTGQLWFDSANPQLYVWYDDGSSAQWVICAANVGQGPLTDAPADGFTYGRRNGVWVSGGAQASGISFGTVAVASTTDLSRHIQLHTLGYGFNVSAGRLNVVNGTGSFAVVNSAGVDLFSIGNTGGVLVNNGVVTVGSATAPGSSLALNGAQGNIKQIRMLSAGVNRWVIQTNATPETGANVGSNFVLSRYSDAGTLLDNPIVVSRDSGAIQLGNGAASNYAIFTPTAAGGTPTLQMAGIDTNVDLTVMPKGAGAVRIGSNTAGYSLIMNGQATATRAFQWRTANLNRWSIQMGNAESGANAGSDFQLYRFDDAGVLVSAPLLISRATGQVTVQNNLQVGIGTDNYVTHQGATTGNTPAIIVQGVDTNIGLRLTTKGQGAVMVDTGSGALPMTGFTGAFKMMFAGPDSEAQRFLGMGFAQSVRIMGARSQGTRALPTALTAGQSILTLQAFGHNGTQWSATATTAINMESVDAFTGAAQGSRIVFSVTAPGSTTLLDRMWLEAAGNLRVDHSTGALPANPLVQTGIMVGGANADFARFQGMSFGGSTQFIGARAGNTRAAPGNIAAGNAIVEMLGLGYGGGSYSSIARIHMRMNAAEAFTATAQGTNWTWGCTEIGTLVTADKMFLSDLGALRCVAGIGAFNTVAPAAKPTVSGSRGGNAALASFLTAMASFGFITDGTSA